MLIWASPVPSVKPQQIRRFIYKDRLISRENGRNFTVARENLRRENFSKNDCLKTETAARMAASAVGKILAEGSFIVMTTGAVLLARRGKVHRSRGR
jgi:hypothetical protein